MHVLIMSCGTVKQCNICLDKENVFFSKLGVGWPIKLLRASRPWWQLAGRASDFLKFNLTLCNRLCSTGKYRFKFPRVPYARKYAEEFLCSSGNFFLCHL